MNTLTERRITPGVKQSTRRRVSDAVRLSLAVSVCLAMSGCGLSSSVGNQTAAAQSASLYSPTATDMSMARTAFARGNYGIAIDYLESELARSPASLSALNGLGSSYDRLGRYDVAQRYYFRALDLAPQSSLTISNIGYSYLLQGRNPEAEILLQLALRYDAGNMTAAANLHLVREAAVTATSDNLLGVASSNIDVTPQQMPEPVQLPEPALHSKLRIEVSNGNGTNGMAARLRQFLQHQGASVVRLTNADNFTYARSTIYYREGYRAPAEAIAAMFPSHTIALQKSDHLAERVDALLLLGWDFSQFEVERITTGETLAQLAR